jgi:hypothetical protein
MTQSYSNPLQIIMSEFKNIRPEIKETFVFETHCEIFACDETLIEEKEKLVETFLNLKGIIQIPEKILQSLQISKGKLVIVKPVVIQS